jgi:hypothetical protein
MFTTVLIMAGLLLLTGLVKFIGAIIGDES